MKKMKQGAAFVVFLLSAAAMDSELYITSGLLAIISLTYLWVSTWKEEDGVHSIRRDGTDPEFRGAKPEDERYHMAEYLRDIQERLG